jgi:hypothetical protein
VVGSAAQRTLRELLTSIAHTLAGLLCRSTRKAACGLAWQPTAEMCEMRLAWLPLGA